MLYRHTLASLMCLLMDINFRLFSRAPEFYCFTILFFCAKCITRSHHKTMTIILYGQSLRQQHRPHYSPGVLSSLRCCHSPQPKKQQIQQFLQAGLPSLG
mmetsp:Transcript_41445/g.67459  ORF Transcript_41445/g.67459 Transcript_41445/m.67459 type:complete len:100 (-) Transcript_41445:76-375(-)